MLNDRGRAKFGLRRRDRDTLCAGARLFLHMVQARLVLSLADRP